MAAAGADGGAAAEGGWGFEAGAEVVAAEGTAGAAALVSYGLQQSDFRNSSHAMPQ